MRRPRTIGMRSRSARRFLFTLDLAGACVLAAAGQASAQPAFQAPPVLHARELLPPDMLAGAHFQVDDLVPTDGLLGHFTLRSGYGTFVAPGRELSSFSGQLGRPLAPNRWTK